MTTSDHDTLTHDQLRVLAEWMGRRPLKGWEEYSSTPITDTYCSDKNDNIGWHGMDAPGVFTPWRPHERWEQAGMLLEEARAKGWVGQHTWGPHRSVVRLWKYGDKDLIESAVMGEDDHPCCAHCLAVLALIEGEHD